MGNFDFSGQRISGKPVKVACARLWPGVDLPPSVAGGALLLGYTGQYNREYLNERARLSAARLEAFRTTAKPWAAMTEEEREARLAQERAKEDILRDVDRVLYPTRGIKGWEGFRKADGADLPFTAADCADLCAELCKAGQEWMFDDVREYCANLINFVANAIPAEVIAGN